MQEENNVTGWVCGQDKLGDDEEDSREDVDRKSYTFFGVLNCGRNEPLVGFTRWC